MSICCVEERTTDPHADCSDGVCRCVAGYDDCDGVEQNGCETNTTVDDTNCGGCGNECAHGQCVAGVCKCDDDFADCDLNPANGCEVDLRVDPVHCGSCGRTCDGGGCLERICQPLAVVTGDSQMWDLSVGTSFAYWTSVGVWAWPLDGSAEPVVLHADWLAHCTAVWNDRVYWLSETGVMSGRVGDPSPTVVVPVSQPGANCKLVATAADLFWWNEYGPLYRAPRSGTATPEQIAPQATWLATDEEHLYWEDGAAIFRYRLDDGTASLLYQEPGASSEISDIATGPGAVYWLFWTDSVKGIRQYLAQPGELITVLEYPVEQDWCELAVDLSGIYMSGCYYSPNADQVAHVEPTTAALSRIAWGQPEPMDLALTERHVYWSAHQSLMRLVK